MRWGLSLTAIAFSLVLGACAGTAVERPDVTQLLAEAGLRIGAGNSRIPRYQVSGWSRLDDYNLIITAGVRDRYLVRLFTPCPSLRSAFMIGFTTPRGYGGRLDRFESIVVRETRSQREICDIEDIFELEPIAP